MLLRSKPLELHFVAAAFRLL